MSAAPLVPKCPKCEGTMEEGFIADRRSRLLSDASQWVEGAPEGFLFLGVKTGGRDKHRVAAYRCTRCGYLEQYARDRE